MREEKITRKTSKVRRCLFIFLLLFLLTTCLNPELSLRCTVFLYTFSPKAFTSSVDENSTRMNLESREIGFTFEDPPVERQTNGELTNWVVTRYGFIYLAKYYGNY